MKKGYEEYDLMEKDDQVKVAFTMKKRLINSNFQIIKGKDEHREYIDYVFNEGFTGIFSKKIDTILDALKYGFSITEKNYKIIEKGQFKGKIGIKSLKSKPVHSVLFYLDDYANIVKIDTHKAESLPGVEAVITHKDVPMEEWREVGGNYRGRVLDRRVRFFGDEVAAVAAGNRRIAEEALRLIEVEYKELPHVFDVEEAINPDVPKS